MIIYGTEEPAKQFEAADFTLQAAINYGLAAHAAAASPSNSALRAAEKAALRLFEAAVLTERQEAVRIERQLIEGAKEREAFYDGTVQEEEQVSAAKSAPRVVVESPPMQHQEKPTNG